MASTPASTPVADAGSIPARTREVATTSGVALDQLVERLRPGLRHAVDVLQVAARLEADGVTDRAAQVEYGFDDVFALAADVFQRLDTAPPDDPPDATTGPSWRFCGRDLSHGPLYLVPCALFPAVLAYPAGTRGLTAVLVIAGGLGWAWSGGTSWLAYHRLGLDDPAGAARVLRWSVACGPPTSAALGVALGGGAGAATLCAGQMAYQLASMVLVFYRREGLLAAAMAPAAVAGVGYILFGSGYALVGGWYGRYGGATTVEGAPIAPGWMATAVLWLTAVGVLTALVLGLRETARAGRADRVRIRAGWRLARFRTDLRGLAWATAYAALSAVYLLHAQVPYLPDGTAVMLTAIPLMAGMGAVEWQARRAAGRVRAALLQVRYPKEFAARVRLTLAGGVAASAGTVAALATPLLWALDRAGVLTPAGVLMSAAYAVLAGAYLLGFLLAGHNRYGALCAALAVAASVHVGGGHLVATAGGTDPATDAWLFLGSAVLLLVILAGALNRVATRPWRLHG